MHILFYIVSFNRVSICYRSRDPNGEHINWDTLYIYRKTKAIDYRVPPTICVLYLSNSLAEKQSKNSSSCAVKPSAERLSLCTTSDRDIYGTQVYRHELIKFSRSVDLFRGLITASQFLLSLVVVQRESGSLQTLSKLSIEINYYFSSKF